MHTLKNMVLILSSCLLIALGACMGINTEDDSQPDKDTNNAVSDEENAQKEMETLLSDMVKKAKHGQMDGLKWTAGETTFDQVEEEWGKADHQEEAGRGLYATYEEQRTVFGMDKQKQVYDLRSHAPELQDITETDAEAILGSADDILHFEEQYILVYNVNDSFLLKLTFPPEEKDRDERHLSHVSVVYLPWEASAENNIQEAIQDMSLSEKIGQLVMVGVEGETADDQIKQFIKERHVGGVLLLGHNIDNAKQTVNLTNALKQFNNNSDIPLFMGIDEEGENISRLPKTLISTPASHEIGTSDNPKWAFDIGEVMAKKVSALGFNVNFAPVLDIDSNPDNPVIGDRSFGSDPETVSDFGIAQMKGMNRQGVIAIPKHFPGHGDTSVDSHIDLPIVHHDKSRIRSFELQPFDKAIKAGSDALMIAHLLVPAYDEQYPASMSKPIITDLLRGELGFSGVIVTDEMSMGAIENNYSMTEAATRSIRAGSDLLLIAQYDQASTALDALEDAVHSGEISESRIDQSVSRILALKEKYDIADQRTEGIDIDAINRLTEETLSDD